MKLSDIQGQDKKSGPTLKLSEVTQPPSALEAGRGVIRDLIIGEKEDYPEMPAVSAGNPADARTMEGKLNIIRQQFPQAQLAGQDKFGNPLIVLGQDVIEPRDPIARASAVRHDPTQKYYMNRPGLSVRDIDEAQAIGKRALLPVAASVALGPTTPFLAAPAVAASGVVSEGVSQALANLQGAKEGYSITEMLRLGVFAGLGEGSGRFLAWGLSKIVPKLTGLLPQRAISESGELTDEAIKALKNAGIGPEDLSAEIKNLLNAEMAKGLTPEQAVRSAAFQRVGAKPTTGQLTREFSQQQLEAEGAKSVNPLVGQPIRQRLAESNRALLGASEDVLTQTGGTADELVAGASAKTALRTKASEMQKATRELYENAIKAKGANSPLPKEAQDSFFQRVVPVLDDFEGKVPPAVQRKLEEFGLFGEIKRDLTFSEAEKFRKLLNVYSDTPDAATGAAINQIKSALDDSINSLALGADDAGKLFETARKSSAAKHAEFSQKDVVQAVVSKRAQFTDVVPDEQVVKKIVFSGSVDDLFKVKKALTTGTKEQIERGAEAWNNLRATTFKRLMDSAQNPNVKNELGDVVFSGARFQTELKKIGDKKLSLLFTPKEMEAIHSIRIVADSVTNKVPGSVNTSNTASALLNDAFKRLPFAGSVSDFLLDLGKRSAIKDAIKGKPVMKAQREAALRARVLPKAGVVYGQERGRE